MGNLCCAKSPTSSPIKINPLQSFYQFELSPHILKRNNSVFNSIYTIQKGKLGFGSYGDVKLCIDKQFSTVKAVKIINKDYLRTSNIEIS